MKPAQQAVWHLLQVSDVLDLEFASALAESVPVIAWEPQRMFLPGSIRPGDEEERVSNHVPPTQRETGPSTPPIIRKLPLLKGFARAPISLLANTGPSVVSRLLASTAYPERSPLICTTPYFAEVAELWPGPVVYWLTDLIAEYASANRDQVVRLDRRMCKAASLVCPNSKRIREYLIQMAVCDPDKIEIIPNATRSMNLLAAAPVTVPAMPMTARNVARPIAGVIGNLAGNMDWTLLEGIIERTPWLSWVFVGPTSMRIEDREERKARERVMAHPRTDFVGKQPYGELAAYARAFDVAILPYKRCEPTYSGSSTRFYEHLAACRPMIGTNGFEELKRKVPLLTLVDTAEEAANALDELRAKDFNDGLTQLRWLESLSGTWSNRAHTVESALRARMHTRMSLAS